MIVIIAGSRSITNEAYEAILIATEEFQRKFKTRIMKVLSGGAAGVDSYGEVWARNTRHCEVEIFEPDWAKYGRGAGMRRNSQMVEQANGLIAIWNGRSRGTLDTINKAKAAGLLVHVHIVPEAEPCLK